MVSVMYEDGEILVVRKKPGVPVQTKRFGEKDMVSLLKNYRADKGEEPYIGVVHRLDQPVEGVMVFAKTRRAAGELGRQFSGGQTEKIYRALVRVEPEEQIETGREHTLTDYLVKDGKRNRSSVAAKDSPGAKKAALSYVFLKREGNLAEVMVRLQTGRHHQIRVQMSHAGYPLVGDCKYGGEEAAALAGGNPLALCSARIRFLHPKTKKRMEFSIEPENPVFDKIRKEG